MSEEAWIISMAQAATTRAIAAPPHNSAVSSVRTARTRFDGACSV